MFKQSLHRNREVILPVLSIHSTITVILNPVQKYAEIQSEEEGSEIKVQNWSTKIKNWKDSDSMRDYTYLVN